jgi:hypothetical protein
MQEISIYLSNYPEEEPVWIGKYLQGEQIDNIGDTVPS